MKLKPDFITHESDDEQIMVSTGDSGFFGMVRSNNTAAFIIDCLKQETTEEQIVDAMANRFEAPKTVIAKDVARVLQTLREIGAIE